MDQRDTQTWVAVELSKLGEERIQEGTLESALRSDLGVTSDFPIFIPAATYPRGARKVTIVLMEGYVFLASGLPETKYFALEKKPYITKVMSTSGTSTRLRTPTTIPDKTISELRSKLREMVTSDLPNGTPVFILDGTYRNLEGVVRDSDPENVFVEIRLRSLELMATVPRVFVEAVENITEDDL